MPWEVPEWYRIMYFRCGYETESQGFSKQSILIENDDIAKKTQAPIKSNLNRKH